MNVSSILAELRSERNRIDAAIAALEAVTSSGPKRRLGRPALTTAPVRRRRRMSAAARAKIAAAQRARWAKQKAKSAKAA